MKNFITIAAVAGFGLGLANAQCPVLQTALAAARGGLTIYADASTFTGLASSGNTVEGGVQVSGGTGTLSGDGNSATGELSINGDLVIQNGAVLDLTSGAQVLVYGNIYVLGNSTLNIASGSNLYYFGGQLQVESGSAVTGNAAPVGNLRLVTPRPANGSADVVSGIARPVDAHSGYNEAVQVVITQYLDGNSTTIVPSVQNYNTSGVTLCNFDGVGTGNVTTTNMGLQPSTTFVINGNTLIVNGAVTGAGTLSGSSTSNLIIAGTAGTLNFTSGSQILKDLTLNNSASASLGTPLAIAAGAAYGTVTVNSAASLASNGNLVLRSDAGGTAIVKESNGSITGETTVERFIPATGRAWRLLTIPLTSSTRTIRDAWTSGFTAITSVADAALQPANNGTLITGYNFSNAAAANAAGFDWWSAVTNAASSIRKYTYSGPNGTWGVTSTPSLTTLLNAAEEGYMLFVRGDRKLASTTGYGSTTLRPKGELKMGTRTFSIPTVASTSFKVIGNPYASYVDFDDVALNPGNSIAIKTDRFWIWDASNGINGGYYLVKKIAGGWNRVPSDFTGNGLPVTNSQILQSSQAIMVEPSATGGTLTINEEDKIVPGGSLPTLFDAPIDGGSFYSNLLLNNAGNYKMSDGVLAIFADSYSKSTTDADDVKKADNLAENMALARGANRLTLEARPKVTDIDTLYLNMRSLTARNYALAFKTKQLSDEPDLTAELEDTYLDKKTTVSLAGDITIYDFSVTSDTASKAVNRFRVVFKPGGTLPLSLIAKAYQHNSGIRVEWNTVNEQGIKHYEVEKSIDGLQFKKMHATAAVNGIANTYDWLDQAPSTGINYYRIKSITLNGQVAFSQILIVNMKPGKAGFTLYPNPVKTNKVSVQFTNMEKGRYDMVVFNDLGQQVLRRVIDHNGANGSQEIELGAILASGVYNAVLSTSAGLVLKQSLTIVR